MKRFIFAALALVMAIGLQLQSAHAQTNDWNANSNAFWNWLSHGQDPRLTVVGIGVGLGADGASWALTRKHGSPPHRNMTWGAAYGVTTFGCAVVYPMVATVVLNRPLTPREAYDGIADCVVPFIGGWLVDAWLPHTAWVDGTPPPPPARHHHK